MHTRKKKKKEKRKNHSVEHYTIMTSNFHHRKNLSVVQGRKKEREREREREMSDLGQIVGVFFNFYFHKFTQSVHIYVVLLTFISSLNIIPREKQFENARRRTERKDFLTNRLNIRKSHSHNTGRWSL